MTQRHFLIGGSDPSGRAETREYLEPNQLCTHGVVVGMTGSGKTGLGIVLLEEAARQGIPCLVIDPKGDMGNLALNFAGQPPPALEPWIDAAGAERTGLSAAQRARQIAERWSAGTAQWGLAYDSDPSLRQPPVEILTPGAADVRPVNLLGSLEPPAKGGAWGDARDALLSGVLGLLGLDADPLTSRPYLLLAALVDRSWREARALSWVDLLGQVLDPPVRKLGVFRLDTFYPKPERQKLAMRLNGLLASPRFAQWGVGQSVDFDRWLAPQRPRSTVLYLAHLQEEERQMVVSLVLGRLIQWMRCQPGSSTLRALVYMDEVAGYAPPTAQPPTKAPLLTLLKQARAYGVGLVLSTQNPADLDYKALSNAGTWMIGRLQTEQDRARLLSGLSQQSFDRSALENRLANLQKRHFVLCRTRAPEPRDLFVRHALCYLRGPLTLREVGRLPVPPDSAPFEAAQALASTAQGALPSPGGPKPEAAGVPIMPSVAAGLRVAYLSQSAEFARALGVAPQGGPLRAGLAARVRLRFDERSLQLDTTVEWEAVWFPLKREVLLSDALTVNHDPRDFTTDAPSGARYAEDAPDLDEKKEVASLKRQLIGELHAGQSLQLWHHPALRLVGRPGETKEQFLVRSRAEAEERSDEQVAKLRGKYETRLERLQNKLRDAERRQEDLAARAQSEQQQEWLGGAASLLSLFLGGGRRSSLTAAARRRTRTRNARRRASHQTERIADLNAEVEQVEDELADEIAEIEAHWAAPESGVTQREVRLEKNDIHVEELTLFWAP